VFYYKQNIEHLTSSPKTQQANISSNWQACFFFEDNTLLYVHLELYHGMGPYTGHSLALFKDKSEGMTRGKKNSIS
jgi:hypothetical protein